MTLLAVTLLPAAFIALGASAQQGTNPDARTAASVDINKPYEPPAASKSVEIGNFYLRKKKYNAALSRFREAAATDPHFAPAYLGLGRAYDKVGLKRKALDAYRHYLDALPSQKQADEAKDVHKDIKRLERQLNKNSRALKDDSGRKMVDAENSLFDQVSLA